MATEDQVREINHPAMDGHYSTDFKQGKEAASQSWKRGAPLIVVSGLLTEASEGDLSGDVVGFAVKDATGVTDTVTDFIPAFEELEMEGTLENGSTGDYALTQADVGALYGLAKTAAGIWYIDQADTTNPNVYIMSLVDPVGTVQGRVRFRLKRTDCAWA